MILSEFLNGKDRKLEFKPLNIKQGYLFHVALTYKQIFLFLKQGGSPNS